MDLWTRLRSSQVEIHNYWLFYVDNVSFSLLIEIFEPLLTQANFKFDLPRQLNLAELKMKI